MQKRWGPVLNKTCSVVQCHGEFQLSPQAICCFCHYLLPNLGGGGIALDLKNYSNVSLCKPVIPNVELNVLVYSA